jgi:hypothetical protein
VTSLLPLHLRFRTATVKEWRDTRHEIIETFH